MRLHLLHEFSCDQASVKFHSYIFRSVVNWRPDKSSPMIINEWPYCTNLHKLRYHLQPFFPLVLDSSLIIIHTLPDTEHVTRSVEPLSFCLFNVMATEAFRFNDYTDIDLWIFWEKSFSTCGLVRAPTSVSQLYNDGKIFCNLESLIPG